MSDVSFFLVWLPLLSGHFICISEIATFYNTRLVVPDRFVAAPGSLQTQVLMGANDFERAPPE
jgi:hypothetical protein